MSDPLRESGGRIPVTTWPQGAAPPGWETDCMQDHGKKARKVVLVTLEPELEFMAVTWDVARCQREAAKFQRWARQLRVKAAILQLHSRTNRKRLPKLSADALQAN